MDEAPNQGATGDAPEEGGSFGQGDGGQSPLSAHAAADTPFERPEIVVASAFVGGFAAAQILRWLGNR